jgi:hypothetical protein
MKKTATVKKTGKKTDNKDNKTDDPKAWATLSKLRNSFFLRENSLCCGATIKYMTMT